MQGSTSNVESLSSGIAGLFKDSIEKAEGSEKLTNWKNEPTADVLMRDYKQASSSHAANMTKINEWLALLNVKSDKSRLNKGRSGIAPKVIRRLLEWRYASLSSTFLNEQNLFQVKSTSPKYIEAAIQNELVLNFQFNCLINKVQFINDFIRTSASEGTVIVRVGWHESIQTKEYEEEIINYVKADENQVQIITQAFQQIQQEMEQTQVDDPAETEVFKGMPPDMQMSIEASSDFGEPVIAEPTGKFQIVKEDKQVANHPSVEVVNANQFIIDPTCKGDFDKAKFCVYVFETNASELKAAGIYKNLDKLGSFAGGLPSSIEEMANMSDDVFDNLTEGVNINAESFKFLDAPRKKLVAYEYWGYYDIDNTGIVQSIVATIVNNVIIRMERNPFPDNKFPFTVIPYLPVKETVYGEPDAELISDNQEVIKAVMRSFIDINARSANGQTAMPQGFLTTGNRKKFNLGEDYEYSGTGMHPAEAIYTHTSPEIPQSMMALVQSQFAEAEAATGIKSFQNGLDSSAYGQGNQGMSGGATAVTQSESDIVFRLTNGLKQIGNKVVAMNQVWLNEEETIAITDNEFVDINRNDLAGDFFLGVDVKSNSDSEAKAQQLTFMMQTLGNTVPWEVTQMFLTEISRLYNLTKITTMIQKYTPQPNEQEAELHQLEVEDKKAEIAKTLAEQEYFQSRSEFIKAQINNTMSDTDLKDLDYLEQENGVKHARQKELMEAQAKAQNEGKIATETLKGKNAVDKAIMDMSAKSQLQSAKNFTDLAKNKESNDSNERRERLKMQNKPSASGADTKSKPAMRGIPNPEYGATPSGLNRADRLGTYISGDASTSVNNQI